MSKVFSYGLLFNTNQSLAI